jgi:hypothetical protein
MLPPAAEVRYVISSSGGEIKLRAKDAGLFTGTDPGALTTCVSVS